MCEWPLSKLEYKIFNISEWPLSTLEYKIFPINESDLCKWPLKQTGI